MRKRLQIKGLPETRPVCQYCGTKLRPLVNDLYDTQADRPPETRNRPTLIAREFIRWDAYWIDRSMDLGFCKLRCAKSFAVSAFLAGYRIVRKT